MKQVALLAFRGQAFELSAFKASPIADPKDSRCGLIPGSPIQVLRMGDIIARDGRPLRCTSADCERLMADGRDLSQDLPILYEHGEDPTVGYEAAGWIDPSSFEVRGDGLWATKVFWTADGYAAIVAKTRRYVSPHFFSELDAEGFIRPTRWIEITVTNTPAIPDMAAIAASVRGGALFFDESGRYPTYDPNAPDSGGRKEREPMKFSADTLKLLGLADGATPEQIEKAVVEKFSTNKGEPAAGTPAPKVEAKPAEVDATALKALVSDTVKAMVADLSEAFRTQAKAEIAAQKRAERVASLLTQGEAEGKITAANREHFSALAEASPEAFSAVLPSLSVIAPVTRKVSTSAPDVSIEATDDEANEIANANAAFRVADEMGIGFNDALELLQREAAAKAEKK